MLKKQLFFFAGLLFGLLSCRQEQPPTAIVKSPDYSKAESFLYRQNDSAFYYFNKTLSETKDSLLTAKAYNQMAIIQSDAGDYFGCQESLSMSLKYLNEQKEGHRDCLASDYNELGMASFNLRNYPAAISFYNNAIKFCNDDSFRLIFLNNQANAYQKAKEYQKALNLYKLAYTGVKKGGREYARVLTNLAVTNWLYHPGYNVAPNLLKAMHIRQKENDLWGLNSSYGHLADYYEQIHPDSAFYFASRMYTVAKRLNSPDDEVEALQKMVKLSPPTDARHYFSQYQQLDDSLQAARNTAKNQFAFIRYDAEKNKADNLRLQKDSIERRGQFIRQSILFYSTLLVLVASAVIAVLWYRKRKQRLDLEARERELRISQRVHDVVANGLYQMMTEIEYQDDIDKEKLLDKIDLLYEQSRDISYDKPQTMEHSIQQKISGLLMSFSSTATKIAVVGNNDETWREINPLAGQQINYVLQELMINMNKHSWANSVVIKFERKNNRVNIAYTDNGIGFADEAQKGNGLINTGNRISSIKGTITFVNSPGKGLKIDISFPVA